MGAFRIKPTDPYLDFFKNQNEDILAGDPYEKIPQETIDLRASQPDDEDFWTKLGKQFGSSQDESLPGNRFAEQANKSIGEFGSFLKNAVLHPIDTGREILESPFKSALSGVDQAVGIASGVPEGMPLESRDFVQAYTPELTPGIPEGVKAGLKVGLPTAAPGSEVMAEPLGKLAEGDYQGGLAELAVLGAGGALLHTAGKGLVGGLKEIPRLAEKIESHLPFEASADAGMFGGNIKVKKSQKGIYQGQEVEILGRRGNSVKIALPDGTSKVVGFSSLGDKTPVSVEAPKGKYEDVVKELEALAGDEDLGKSLDERLGRPEGYTEPGKLELPEEKTHIVDQLNDLEKTLGGGETKNDTLNNLKSKIESFDKAVTKKWKDADWYVEAKNSNNPEMVADREAFDKLLDEGKKTPSYGADLDLNSYVSSLPNGEGRGRLGANLESMKDLYERTHEGNTHTKPVKLYRRGNVNPNSPFQSYTKDQNIAQTKFGGDYTEVMVPPEKILSSIDSPSWPKEKLNDPYRESEYLVLSDKGLEAIKGKSEEIPFVDPNDVSIVLPDKNIIPEYADFPKQGRPGKQGPPKPPRNKPPESLGGEGEPPDFPEEGPKPEDWLKTAAKEVPKIEKAQATEEIRDQSFRDQIFLQDEILKGQEQEALKAGKAEAAHQAALDRKILRAQNEEVFKAYKEEQKAKLKSEKEQLALQNKILKGQESEALADRKQKENFTGRGEGVKPETPGQWLLDLFRVPAALKASGDIPALSHARFDTLAHPIDAVKRLKEAGKAVFSPEKEKAVFEEIANDPMFKDAMKAELPFTKQGYDLGAQSFGSYTAEHALGPISEVVKASERGQNVYLDKARMDRFKQMMKDAGINSYDQDPKGAKEIAKAAGIFTGYGKLETRQGEAGIRALNTVMWSARKRLARAQHLKMLGQALIPGSDINPTVRKEVFRQAIPTIAVGLGLLKIAQDQGAKVDWDPKNSNFMKARFPTEGGKYVAWGPFGDYTGIVKLAVQEATGEKITDKGEYDLDDPKGPFAPTRTSIIKDYGYNSLNPSARGIWDYLDPNVESSDSPFLDVDEYPGMSKALEGITPINASNQKQLYDELGPVSSLFAPFITAGENIDVYDPDKFTKQKERIREEKGLPPKSSRKKGKRKGKVLSTY